MQTLITGGAGFIGSHIQDKLIELGHKVAIVDSLRSGKTANLNPSSKFFQVDIRNANELKKTFDEVKPEVVFHLAAQNEVPFSMEHPEEDYEINIIGMINVLSCAQEHKSKVVYSNTGGALYGEVEEKDLPISEDFPSKKPSSFYGVSKGCGEAYLRLYGNIYNVPYVSLRYSNVFGPRQDGNREAGIVAIFTSKMVKGEVPTINGDGLHTRDYVFVKDVVDANINAMNYKLNDYFNISSSNRISNNEVFETLKKTLGTNISAKYGPDRQGDARHISLSNQKARTLLKWQPNYSFEAGVQETIKFYTQ
jgi:UDP-glucose 4-epimerase